MKVPGLIKIGLEDRKTIKLFKLR